MSARRPTPAFRDACAAAVFTALLLTAPAFGADTPAPGERDIPPDTARKTQRESKAPPPSAPSATPTDPGAALPPPPSSSDAPTLQMRREKGTTESAPFNPDPGASQRKTPAPEEPFFKSDRPPPAIPLGDAGREPGIDRGQLELPRLELTTPAAPKSQVYGSEPLPADQALPRAGVRENRAIPKEWHPPGHSPAVHGAATAPGAGPNTQQVPDRWKETGFVSWRRYTSGDTNELPYYHPKPERWHYYRQSVLKGDLPIRGQDVFLSITASGEMVFEDRKITLPSNNSSSRPGSFDFFGESRTNVFVSNFGVDVTMFRGETVFKPVEWAVKFKPVFNFNHVSLRETLVSPDPRGAVSGGVGVPVDNSRVNNPSDIDALLRGGLTQAPPTLKGKDATSRDKGYIAIQELFYEKHLKDLSANYDFCAIKVGNQTFNSDFRGFVFNDTNFGARFFGNYDANRWQYNLAVFDLREKDTNSDLNTFDRRGQIVAIANVYKQDFWHHGYTAQLNLHASFDQSSTHYDTNGGIVRPAPLGTARAHRVNSYYLGWTGDGHMGRWNVSHAAYLVTGRDQFNGLAGQPVDILAGLGAIEVSYDRDWLRYKASVVAASGDRDPEDGKAHGFDSILDNTNFTGGPFSYFMRQGFNLAGTSVGLKQRFSLLNSMRTSKTEGQQNFVNPGTFITSLGADMDVTPKLRAFVNANYIRFMTTAPLKTALLTNRVSNEFGTDLSIGFQWRPGLTDNVILSAGCGALLPGRGFRDIYRRTQPGVPGFTPVPQSAAVDRWLHSTVVAATLTY